MRLERPEDTGPQTVSFYRSGIVTKCLRCMLESERRRGTLAPEPSAADSKQMDSKLLLAQAKVPVLSNEDTALLVVAALLCFWLWLLVRRREEEKTFQRPTPLSLNELGRMVFQAARSQDQRTWRALFLNGAEAAARMGQDAEQWLEDHSMVRMADLLEALGQCIPPRSIYIGCENQPDGRCALMLRKHEGEEFLVAVGRATQIGPAWRLIEVG